MVWKSQQYRLDSPPRRTRFRQLASDGDNRFFKVSAPPSIRLIWAILGANAADADNFGMRSPNAPGSPLAAFPRDIPVVQ